MAYSLNSKKRRKYMYISGTWEQCLNRDVQNIRIDTHILNVCLVLLGIYLEATSEKCVDSLVTV